MLGRNIANKAFTLIELSVVIAILGLIIASIMAGSQLVDHAQANKMIASAEKYRMAVRMFKDNYGALPGDMSDSQQFFPSLGQGNGDGGIVGCCGSNELYYFWAHLGQLGAGLIPETYSGTGTGAVREQNVPPNAMLPDGYWYPHYDTLWSIHPQRNSLGTDNSSTNDMRIGFVYKIDKKIDDGLPFSGDVIGYGGTTCTNIAPASATSLALRLSSYYLIQNSNARACSINFSMGVNPKWK